MQTIILYRIARPDGSVTVTPNEPEQYESTLYRLVADEGMELVKGDERTIAVDADSVDGWEEVEAKVNIKEEGYYAIHRRNERGLSEQAQI